MPDRTLPGIQSLQQVVVLMMENRSFRSHAQRYRDARELFDYRFRGPDALLFRGSIEHFSASSRSASCLPSTKARSNGAATTSA